jgi:predicted P-loop ATPase
MSVEERSSASEWTAEQQAQFEAILKQEKERAARKGKTSSNVVPIRAEASRTPLTDLVRKGIERNRPTVLDSKIAKGSDSASVSSAAVKRRFSSRKNPGNIATNLNNTIRAIEDLGVECRLDVFHDKLLISRHPFHDDTSLDSACLVLRDEIFLRFSFDTSTELVIQAVKRIALNNRFDPVVDYLNGLRWDGVQRLDTMLSVYFQADDNPLNRVIGRKMIIAAVRRAKQPGCKFDFIVVMDNSKQGTGKSTAVKILAGDDNFSDAEILTSDQREQQELTQGVWIYELPELIGLSKADLNRVKAFASRTVDRARPAYERSVVEKPRRCIFIGTTNDKEYLQDPTGNRRFWPFTPGKIDLPALARDRDQLFAEAVVAESAGEELIIPEALWAEAEARQQSRLISDPWEDPLSATLSNISTLADSSRDSVMLGNDKEGNQEWRIASNYLLCACLRVPAERLHQSHAKRLAMVMRKLGWTGPEDIRLGNRVIKGYVRKA